MGSLSRRPRVPVRAALSLPRPRAAPRPDRPAPVVPRPSAGALADRPGPTLVRADRPGLGSPRITLEAAGDARAMTWRVKAQLKAIYRLYRADDRERDDPDIISQIDLSLVTPGETL
jgi:hypothetical protein